MNIKLKRLLSALAFSLICFFLTMPFLLSGELYPIEFVANVQGIFGDSFRFGAAYTNNPSYYKLLMAQKTEPKVLALGTSRVMQFNNFFFNTSFYNAGGGFAALDAAIYFLQQLKQDKLPQYLILGLDEYFFNDNYFNVTREESFEFYNTPDVKPFSKIFNNILSDVQNGKIKNLFALPFSLSKIGIMAKVNNQGFENDGSYYYGSVYAGTQSDSERIKDTLLSIKNKTNRYVAGENINQYTIDMLAQLCEYAKKMNIKIIAFTPPMAPECYNLAQQSGDFAYLDKITNAAKPILDKYGFEFYNFTDMQPLGVDNSYFIDGFHGSDVAYLKILLEMLDKGSCLNEVCDKDSLQKMYDQRLDNFLIN